MAQRDCGETWSRPTDEAIEKEECDLGKLENVRLMGKVIFQRNDRAGRSKRAGEMVENGGEGGAETQITRNPQSEEAVFCASAVRGT